MHVASPAWCGGGPVSMSAVEPGTRLADRFRLEDRVSESGGATLWKAIDEILARPVAVHTFSPEFPRESEVVLAARAASRLTDPRLTQVFDAADEDGTAYVVSEWVHGESLLDLLAAGPMEPERGAVLVAEAAEALAHAHEAGMCHLNLTPGRLMWTEGGTVKLLGVGVDAAILGREADSPEEAEHADAEGLGRLLYAALTGHWPGEEDCGLPPAPLDDGKICTPRQVTAGVPGYLDTIAARILGVKRGPTPLSTPGEVAEALSQVPRPVPAPASTVPPSVELRAEAVDTLHARPVPPPPAPPRRPPGMFSRFLVTLVALLVMAVVGVGAWSLGKSLGTESEGPASEAPTTPGAEPAKTVALTPAGAIGFDPLGDGEERNELAPRAIDGSYGTDWHTESYNDAKFGGLKKGVGLLIDLGRDAKLTKVMVDFGDVPGGAAELKLGGEPTPEALTVAASTKEAMGKVTFDLTGSEPSRYLMVWFTALPPYQSRFRGMVLDMEITATED
ncbi:serine/threonine protein kinase [Acrocarpospora pleiomorpha]|uniref:Serine/threonine protein kinase n=1 Tax=Acrocarpospora pleiomorpha TaxID=90975 RepID=A0A5M3XV98_9ACTN|nr:protein kinase family protein [Acrocarpospora pleiomorpha]GES24830.1 serine/threonine protein kinase [Acrocarpospora pleiomorpha]